MSEINLMEVKMKTLVLFVVLLAGVAMAEDHSEKMGGKWQERKAKVLKRLTANGEKAAKHRACVEGATTKDTFKSCMKTARLTRKEGRMNRKMKKLEGKMKKLKMKKARL